MQDMSGLNIRLRYLKKESLSSVVLEIFFWEESQSGIVVRVK